MTLMGIRGVTLCPQHERPILLLEDQGRRRRLAMLADPHEAHGLARELGLTQCRCNPVYDLIHSLLDTFHATVTRVVVDEVNGKGISARIYFRRPDGELSVPRYPPHALALALRANVPIFATAEALTHAEPVPASPDSGAEQEDVSQWLERVRPEDF